MKIFFSLVFFCFLVTYNGQTKEIERLFKLGEYERCIEEGKKKLANEKVLEEKDILEIHKYLGLAYALTDRSPEAKKHFKAILKKCPTFELEEGFYPDKVMNLWQEVKGEMEKVYIIKIPTRPSLPPSSPPEGSIPADKSLFKLVAFSFIPGGFIQFKTGQKKKGFFIAGLELIFLSASLYGYSQWNKEYNPDLGRFNNFEKAQNYKKLQNWGFNLCVLTYLYGVLDGIWYSFFGERKVK